MNPDELHRQEQNAKASVRKRALYKRRVAARLCTKCGRPALPGEFLCEVHINRINILGGKCIVCGETNPIYLTIDHTNNDGAEDRFGAESRYSDGMVRATPGGGHKIYLLVIRGQVTADRVQLLCSNCHIAKHRNNDALYYPYLG